MLAIAHQAILLEGNANNAITASTSKSAISEVREYIMKKKTQDVL